jgi:hypothetical protein
MKLMNTLIVISMVILYSACVTKAKFGISTVVPAADITAKKKVDVQKNYTLEITAINLASADRLTPPGNNYSVWIVTKAYGLKNVGQLNVKNAEKTIFNTITPFDFREVVITVENKVDLNYPEGVEIARAKF